MTGPQQYGNGLGPLAAMFAFFAACIALWAVIGILIVIVRCLWGWIAERWFD